jgi:putative transposase
MLSDADIERHMVALQIPTAGRTLIRQIREQGPVRDVQTRMQGVRTRFISTKMDGRALLAESRTCEFLGIYIREFDPNTLELWPQPCYLDLTVTGPKGKTRLQHTPDLFLVERDAFVIEEWRMEDRLQRYARERPHHFHKDAQGLWHYVPVEEHLANLGITYRLRSQSEHPQDFLSNLQFLEDYTRESAPPVPADVTKRLKELLQVHKRIPHLELVQQHGFEADHIFQEVLAKRVFVDLYGVALREVNELVIYENEAIASAEKLLKNGRHSRTPSSALALAPGARFNYDGNVYEVALIGQTEVTLKTATGGSAQLPLDLVDDLFKKAAITAQSIDHGLTKEEVDDFIFNTRDLERATAKLIAINSPDQNRASLRTLQRDRKRIAGIESTQEQLRALTRRPPENFAPRVPPAVSEAAEKVLKEKFNTPIAPTVQSAFMHFQAECEERGLLPMSRSSFFELAKRRTSVLAREGRRAAYQQKPIPLTFDYGHPVHGVLPHEVVYCDHTILNIMLKGMVIQNLGKPTLTIMVDGSLSKTRAMFLSYQPASVFSVLMCLRDYVRRNNRLPRVLVLDNGKEFHSETLQRFCDLFKITIRWRRASMPRDSAMVERMLGATEQEVLAQLGGNSIGLKDLRNVSSTHLPEKHIEWTLPALHGALDHFLFDLHPSRIHPRFGISPNDFEKQLVMQMGARRHMTVRFDQMLLLLTAPEAQGGTRVVDPVRGVFVDGVYHWHPAMEKLKGVRLPVCLEPWNAELIYVEINGAWTTATARDSGLLRGRFRYEFAMQAREETRRRKSLATADKSSPTRTRQTLATWRPQEWDPRLREQMAESHLLYEKLGMTEVFPEGRNEFAKMLELDAPPGSRMDFYPELYGVDAAPPPSSTPLTQTSVGDAIVLQTSSHDAESLTEPAIRIDQLPKQPRNSYDNYDYF